MGGLVCRGHSFFLMKKLSNMTLQHLPHHWGKLSGPRKVWYLNSRDCSPILESWWGILSQGELQLFTTYQTLTPEFVTRNWKHFNPLVRLIISQYQMLPERVLAQMWHRLSSIEKHEFGIRMELSREFMISQWHALPESLKTFHFVTGEQGRSLPKGELPMFLSDSNAEVRALASRYLKAWIGSRLVWKATYYLERYICQILPNRWRGYRIALRRRRRRRRRRFN